MTRVAGGNDMMPDGPSKPASRWYNAKDGHTYWLDEDGDLMAAPTLWSGEADWECASYVDDFNEALTDLEKASIMERLRGSTS